MKTVKLTKDIPGEGLSKGDVISVNPASAAVLIERKDAEAYETPKATDGSEAQKTIDDIVDPQVARNRRNMTATIVGGPGADRKAEVQTTDQGELPAGAASKSSSSVAAPGPNPAGGASGGTGGGQ
jgi:hypothetical protein